jgi:hypothetical protein
MHHISIDQYLKGRHRWSELLPNGKPKYHWLDWHKMETPRAETYLDSDYGGITL